MATDDKNRRPKFVDFGVDQSLPAPLAAQIASQQAGGGALGRGVGARKFLGQTILGPAENTINAGAGLVGAVVQPVGSFAEGFLYGGPRPSAPAATALGATGAWGVSSNFPTLRSVVSPEQAAPAPALTRTPSRGQPAPAAPAPIAPPVSTPITAASSSFSCQGLPRARFCSTVSAMDWGNSSRKPSVMAPSIILRGMLLIVGLAPALAAAVAASSANCLAIPLAPCASMVSASPMPR